jgi:glycosyltransferase involved in cell wall biosynthesis
MKIPITVLCNARFPSTAAHGVYLARLCESLAQEGHDVELIVPKRFGEVKDDPFHYYDVKASFRITKIWSFDFLVFGKVLRKAAFILQYLNFYLFVLSHFLFRSRKRIIYTMDNLGCLLSFLGYRVIFETHVSIGGYRKYLLPLLHRSEKMVAVNSLIKRDFVNAGFSPEKILVAPNGVDLSLFSNDLSKEDLRKSRNLPLSFKIISYVGKYKTMGVEKGVDEILRSFHEVQRKNTHLLIVGLGDDEKKEVTDRIQTMGIPAEMYTLIGHVTQKEAASYMRLSDILVMNYPNTPYYATSMSPMKMFEYMASGNPIVATDLPSIKEVLNESNACLIDPNKPDSLTGAFRSLLDSEQAAKRLSEAAKNDVLSYTWKKRAEKILTFIGF